MEAKNDVKIAVEKVVEKLIVSTTKSKSKNICNNKPENEQINHAVMKVLQGYEWKLETATSKQVFNSAKTHLTFYEMNL